VTEATLRAVLTSVGTPEEALVTRSGNELFYNLHASMAWFTTREHITTISFIPKSSDAKIREINQRLRE